MLFDLTLEKNLFLELDPDKIDAVVERKLGKYDEGIVRTLEFSFKRHPEIKSISSVKRHYAYYDKCYIHLGDDLENPASLRDKVTKECILELYSKIAPDYLKKELDFDDDELDLREYFDAAKVSDGSPKYAFPGLVTFEDIKSGKVELKDGPSFPGIRVLSDEEKQSFIFPGIRANREEPAYSTVEGYTKIEGESQEERNDNLLSELEALKKKFNVEKLV